MSVNFCVGVFFAQAAQQHEQCLALLRGARVLGRLSVSSHAADVADANRASVMSRAVRADFSLGATGVHRAVTIDHMVVADGTEATLLVPAGYVFHGEVLALWRGCAVDDDFSYLSFHFAG